ncbi:hypothetical protein FB382_001465 [Nocardioides ginsengisegetis]|uniref:Spermidine synthase n=1 Tax=Nocardioides ginsengisegetis TaxID=661491 RepID=A0A7W3P980_9ACTN|nr:fused MFS/spermidine synthase [Nocardioides ginsengisegetis]MBA8803174.1 hypothetical protein [Nocardioides ginsengisegetis]
MAIDQSVARQGVAAPPPATERATGLTAVLFTITAFLGAGLLFVVEPLVAKLLLPSYGGSATVWSTCSLFFQSLLLLAYGYCHWSTTRLGRTWQPRAHLVALVLPLVVLPLAVPADAAPPSGATPALWLIRTLVLLIGLPFVAVATTGPLLQKWYSWTSGPRSDDPYFLFAASNFGSFVGLLAYPLWVEPRLTLAEQRVWWSIAYGVFLVLTATCALVAGKRRSAPSPPAAHETLRPPGRVRPSTRRMLVWALLAMLPSTLMLGVTTHLSTDVAAIPLLWVVPLALYLGSFVLAFARRSRAIPATATRLAVALGLVEALVSLGGASLPISVSITTSMLMLVTVAYAAHARLAVDRPDADQLTLFYLVVAVGGVLGGLLNGLLAPAIFSSVLEYPIALSAVPLLLIGVAAPRGGFISRQVRANLVRAACVLIAVGVAVFGLRVGITQLPSGLLGVTALLLATGALGWLLTQHPALALAAVLVLCGSNAAIGRHGVIEQTRTFYGTYRVLDDGTTHTFVHGTTVHGTQFLDPTRRDVPTTYYAKDGPLGDVFAVADELGLESVGAVGLGAGTLAAYGRAGQHFTFFEIDPEVVRIAEDPRYFSYLHDSRAAISTVTGDGRLGLSREPDGSFDLLVLDAFSSDAIPVHLLTQEAIEMYADKLTDRGSLAFHITNRTFDLRPVLQAAAASLGWTALVRTGTSTAAGGVRAVWVVMGPDNDTLEALAQRPGWSALSGRSVAWTDDYSSVLSVLR